MLSLSYDKPNRFGPSRSTVMSTRGMVATSQPLAALTGVEILRQGGNAIDAAIAAAAMLNVIEPMSTGVGGDAFAIIYEAKSGKTHGLNASGRSAHAATPEEHERRLSATKSETIPTSSMLTVTVPGAVDGWCAMLKRFGRMSLREVLAPAIQVAEEGFAVAPQTAIFWRDTQVYLAQHPDSARTWLVASTRAPRAGEKFKTPNLARTLRLISDGGREAFYHGPVADAIIRFSEAHGGLLTHRDFADHECTWVEPLRVSYRGYEILELPPNGQGITVLQALNILAEDGLAAHNTPDAIHLQIEAIKLALHDSHQYVTDPDMVSVPVAELISAEYAKRQRARISSTRAIQQPAPGQPLNGDTVYLCVADTEGNVVSFINSIFIPWGSGLTVGDTGIVLQNRGISFSLDPNHPNVIAPHKRTRHTILPAMMFYQGQPLTAFGCVGGDVQPQAQVQFLCNLIDYGMNVQDALDAPRWRYEGFGASVALEAGFTPDTWADLAVRGHHLTGSGGFFGGGQALLIHPEYGTFHGGSDPRRDGCVIGY